MDEQTILSKACLFNTVHTNCPLEEIACPAEQAVQMCNKIMLRFIDKEYDDIRENFDCELQNGLVNLGYKCLVFWTPDKEKDETRITSNSISSHISQLTSKNINLINDAIFQLNNRLHSLPFLRKLAKTIPAAKNRVFSLCKNDECWHLIVSIPMNMEHDTRDSSVLRYSCSSFVSCESIQNVLSSIQASHGSQLLDTIEHFVNEPFCDKFAEVLSSTVPATELSRQDREEILPLWSDASKHFRLMAFFSELNKFSSATYYLSPLDKETLQSSMVIYWEGNEPTRSFHSLIQMLLGMNAAPALLQNEQIMQKENIIKARKAALAHYGHTLGHRLSVVSRFIENSGDWGVKIRNIMLKDLSLLLQLNAIDDRKELESIIEKRKVNRFFDQEIIGDKDLDLVEYIIKWGSFFDVDQIASNTTGEIRTKIELIYNGPKVTIGFPIMLNSISPTCRARLKPAFYRELFFELLDNIFRYGTRFSSSQSGMDKDIYHYIRAYISVIKIELNNKIMDMIVLSNEASPDKATQSTFVKKALKDQCWTLWPNELCYDGPGMAIELFRRLEIGEMFYKVDGREGRIIFNVGITLEGLHVIGNS